MTSEPGWVRLALITAAVVLVGLFIGGPIAIVFHEALAPGWRAFAAAILRPEARNAMRLTLEVAALVVPTNLVVGLCAAWLLARYQFAGKRLLLAVIDIPLSVSPVISGLIFVLLFGRTGIAGPFLARHGIRILFALPGLVLATTFVTFPLIVREVLPVLRASGCAEEEAALTLGAGGLRIFFRVTLPKIRWGLFYGLILCNARAMGEFGAVSVVSGHIRGATDTLPLHIENLYNDYDSAGAFALASLLTLLALATLAAKQAITERRRS